METFLLLPALPP